MVPCDHADIAIINRNLSLLSSVTRFVDAPPRSVCLD
jgi:hypothetical protein